MKFIIELYVVILTILTVLLFIMFLSISFGYIFLPLMHFILPIGSAPQFNFISPLLLGISTFFGILLLRAIKHKKQMLSQTLVTLTVWSAGLTYMATHTYISGANGLTPATPYSFPEAFIGSLLLVVIPSFPLMIALMVQKRRNTKIPLVVKSDANTLYDTESVFLSKLIQYTTIFVVVVIILSFAVILYYTAN